MEAVVKRIRWVMGTDTDVVLLHCNGAYYNIKTPVGRLKVGQEVKVTVTVPGEDGHPREIGLDES